MRLVVNGFIGNRNVAPSDVQDLLCGPTDVPIRINDGIQAVSQRPTQAFYDMVEEILSCKEHGARLCENEERAAPNDCALSEQTAERDSRTAGACVTPDREYISILCI